MKYVFLIAILMIGLVSAGTQICIDLDAPTAPSGLGVSGDASSRLLVWGASIDEPDCSGIAEYVISLDGVEIDRVNGDTLSYTDTDDLGSGKYIYSVYAIDLVGELGGKATANEITIGGGNNGGGGVSGGSSGSSYVCVEDWECEDWTDCTGNDMRRICDDLNKCGTELEKPETYQECGMSEDDDGMIIDGDIVKPNVSQPEGFFSAITGAVTGAVGTASGMVVSGFILLVLFGFVGIRIHRKFKK